MIRSLELQNKQLKIRNKILSNKIDILLSEKTDLIRSHSKVMCNLRKYFSNTPDEMYSKRNKLN